MTALLIIVNDVHSLLQNWAGDSSRYVVNLVTKAKHQPPDFS